MSVTDKLTIGLRGAYLASLGLSFLAAFFAVALVLLFWGVTLVPNIPDLGNGGAFLAALGMAFFLLSAVVATAFGFLGAALAFVFPDKLPQGRIYKVQWCAAVAAPGCIVLLYLGWRALLSLS